MQDHLGVEAAFVGDKSWITSNVFRRALQPRLAPCNVVTTGQHSRDVLPEYFRFQKFKLG
jgi:hypothetical protein